MSQYPPLNACSGFSLPCFTQVLYRVCIVFDGTPVSLESIPSYLVYQAQIFDQRIEGERIASILLEGLQHNLCSGINKISRVNPDEINSPIGSRGGLSEFSG